MTTIWLAHILSQGDHRKLTVREWVHKLHITLEAVSGQPIRKTDFTDDRLTGLLKYLGAAENWRAIEKKLTQQTLVVYQLESQRVRLDATNAPQAQLDLSAAFWTYRDEWIFDPTFDFAKPNSGIAGGITDLLYGPGSKLRFFRLIYANGQELIQNRCNILLSIRTLHLFFQTAKGSEETFIPPLALPAILRSGR